MRGFIFFCGVLVLANMAWAQDNLLPNGDFEEGDRQPSGWEQPEGGEWVADGGVGGSAAIAVAGDGKGSAAWRSAPVEFLPGHLYRLSFAVRGVDAAGGTAISGPSFANVDIGAPGKEWRLHEHVFATTKVGEKLSEPVRLGQWMTSGHVIFDDARLALVRAVHAPFGTGLLGDGEKLEGQRYLFTAPLGGAGRNYCRPLQGFKCGFNSDRWCFGTGSFVTYRHALAGRKLLSGNLNVGSGYYVSGRLMVDVSNNGGEWHHVGALTNAGAVQAELPAALFPAEFILVRLRGVGQPCALQVHGYSFEGDVDGEPATVSGCTSYVEVLREMPRFKVQVRSMGEGRPGGDNNVVLHVRNATGQPQEAEARVVFRHPGEIDQTNAVQVAIPGGGQFDVSIPYEIPGVGEWRVDVELGDAFAARGSVYVPDYYDESYGELLPVRNPALSLWRASSGWKIPEFRRLPRKVAKGLSLRLARNEWEATQLVVTPNVELTGVTVSVSDLACGRERISADQVTVLRTGYVPVTRKTDKTGTLAPWPDPLLPQSEPATLAAGRNQPYWIRVRAPGDVKPGIYRGTVTVHSEAARVTVPLSVEVYDFELPDTLTCETAFGFNAGTVCSYHGVTEPEQRRLVVDKYLRTLGEHGISVYNPAPLDGWGLEWQGLSPWRGGQIVTDVKFKGEGALRIVDDSTERNVGAQNIKKISLPEQGLKISFAHRTDTPHHFLLTLNFHDGAGNWMSGRNSDIRIEGVPEWQRFERTFTSFPPGANSCKISFYAAGWQEPVGTATGTLWVDDMVVVDNASGRVLLEGGDMEPVDVSKVEPVFDWTRWDAAMERAFAEYRINSFRMNISGLGGGTFHARSEPTFMGYPETAPEYDILLGKYLRGIEAHLREKGWLDKAYVYWFDEPDPKDYEFVMNGFAKLKKHAPGLRRMLTEQVEDELVGGPNLWCPLTPSLNVKGTEARRAAGDQFWWYVCCGPVAPYVTEFIDHPGTEMRLWLWQTWAERVSGILIWESVYWTSNAAYPDKGRRQNPYLDPMSWVSGYDTPPGTKRPWGNGDGRFLYPPPAAADGNPAAPVLDDPVVSIRLEMLRDGLEDYEYFVILKRLLAEKGDTLTARQRADYEALLTVPANVSSSLTLFTTDPEPLEEHRDKLARAIVALSKRKR